MKLTAWEQFSPSVRKAWRVMRITTLLILVISLQLSAKTTAQKITLSSTNISIEQFFSQLEKQTGYSFLLENAMVSKDEKISVDVKDVPLETVLDQILRPLNLSYKIENKTVYILKASQPVVSADGTLSFSSPIEIHGHVTDSLGNPLAGASVTVKGSKRGTSTDVNGDFTLKDVPENSTLNISFTGYDTKSIKLSSGNSYTVSLVHSTSLLDQVQIIAYGTTTQRLATGDVGTVTAEEIEQQPVTNPVFALEGRVPGLYIAQTTGNPGSAFNVQIRGLNSIASGNRPLYIVDGVPYTTSQVGSTSIGRTVTLNDDLLNPLNFINPLDIESIDVLKDADATAIYGSMAANGVILITTKKGKAGRTKVDINLFSGVGMVGHYMDLLNTPQYLMMRREAFANDSISPNVNTAPDLFVWDTTKYTNWQRKLIGGTAHNTNAQVSISGGNKNTQFLISGDYRKDGSIYPGDFADKRGSINLSINNISENQKFKINLNVNYLSDNDNYTQYEPTLQAVTFSPNLPDQFLDSKGNYIWPANVYTNPYAVLNNKYLVNANNLIGKCSIHYQLLSEVELSTDFGFNRTNLGEISTEPIISNNPANGVTTGSAQFANSSNQTWNIEPQINWKKQIGGGKLIILLGTTFLETIREGSTIAGYGYTNDALLENIGSAGSLNVVNSTYAQYKYNAFFGRINYNYKDKYLINLTGRRDGSSRFGPGNQFSNFGAIGAAWIFSNESFMKDNFSFLSFGKLRGSYGIAGNDQISDYGYVQLWNGTGYPFQGSPAIYPSNLSNPNYGWERDQKLEIGLNLGFINDRILLAVSLYRNRSDNQLVGLTLPPSVGYTTVQANLPATVQNSGIEIEMNTINVKSQTFSWSTSFNISIPRNKLVSYPGIENSIYVNTYTVGKSLYTQKTLQYINVDPTSGVYQFQDLNGNGSGLDVPQDLRASKQIAQDFYGGFQNSFSFKGFQLDIFFQFVKQTAQSPYFNIYFGPPGGQGNQLIGVLNRWKMTGDHAGFQRYTTGYGADYSALVTWYNTSTYGDNAISDASFIRLKNLSLSYNLPSKLIQKVKLDRVRLFIQAQNLITFTSYKGLDPEYPSVINLPPLKIITAGFQLTL